MYDYSPAAGARTLLQRAANRLQTASPVYELGDVIDASVTGASHDDSSADRPPLQPRFEELSSGALAFDLLPAGRPRDRVELASEAARGMTARHFGPRALHWLDSRLEVAADIAGRQSSWGASLGSGFGRNGVLESAVHLEWGPQLLESLPARLHRLVQIALEEIPGLRPAFSTVRTTPRGGSQQVTFELPRALPLQRLRPLMTRLGLGHQHASIMSTVALLLGARFTLPPNAAMITMRLGPGGVEMRLDVNLDAIPDPPPEIGRLLGLQMAERPRSLRAFRRWVAALTPEGFEGPGRLSVLSVVVRPDMPARLILNLCPASMEARSPRARRPEEAYA